MFFVFHNVGTSFMMFYSILINSEFDESNLFVDFHSKEFDESNSYILPLKVLQ